MRTEFSYNSCGAGQIHAYQWTPSGSPRAIVQFVHGIAEHALRYEDCANFLTDQGILVIAEDHMGHGRSVGTDGIQGYFRGGWFAAVDDTYALLQRTMQQHPGVPYILLGHSMGSFMVRTILTKYPDSGITGCVICGTGWQPKGLLSVAIPLANYICKTEGETKPSKKLHSLVFGGYNRKVEHPRTASDWLTRDVKVVDAFIADPMCGFAASAGLMRDMFVGIAYIEEPKNLGRMRKDTPVLFVAGGDDPVGDYGKGVAKASSEFKKSGMTNVETKLYPLCRHEILSEINKNDVYHDILSWIERCIVC